MKAPIANPKAEIQNPKELRKPKFQTDSRTARSTLQCGDWSPLSAPRRSAHRAPIAPFVIRNSSFVILLLLSTLISQLSTAFAQPTAFTYQGQLTEDGAPFTGSAEFQFTLWDAESGGAAVATNDPPELVAPVSNGLFTVELDFGGDVFDGRERFLQIEVRTTIGSFTTLSPRQRIAPSPQAIHATSADTAVQALTVDMGTISNPSFIGTTDDQPLELYANNQRALRLESAVEDANHSNIVNVVGGSPENFVGAGVYGATIGGGGALNFFGFTRTNSVEADFGTVSGGLGNTIQPNGFAATIPGGEGNSATRSFAFAAGRRAKANHQGAFVWADSQIADFTSNVDDEFAIRARAGVRIANSFDGATLLRLETERPWEFRQRGSGASTALELVSLDSSGVANKHFIINTTGGGSVGIGTTAPGFTLHVNGSAGKPGGGSWSSASDARLKETRQPFTRGLAALEKLTPTHYRYAPDNALDLPSDREYVGLIAQDVQAAIPEAIEPNETGYLHLNNDPILWTMLNGIKELNRKADDRNRQLERKLEQKETEIGDLRARMERLEQMLHHPLNGGAR